MLMPTPAPSRRPTSDRRILWLATDEVGLGHAQLRHAPRTFCGVKATTEQHAWPVLHRCPECVEVAG